MNVHDDDLLDVLAASLGPPPNAEPSWAEISQLHRVIDSGWSSRRTSRAPIWRIRRPLTAAVAGLVVLGSASAAAAVSGAVMPQPVRVAARAVGLPVDSPQLAHARAAIARLRDTLGDKPRDLDSIRADAQAVRDHLARLSADDRSHVEDEAAFLLAEADAALAPPPVPLGSPVPSAPPANPANGALPAPAAAPAGDDHGGPGPSAETEHTGTGSGDQRSGDDHSGSSAQPSGSGVSGPGPSGSSDGDGEHTATTIRTDNSGPGSSDGGTSDGGSSHDGGSSGSDGGHSGPG